MFTPTMNEQIKKMRYKGLCCGAAPVYLEIYQEEENSPMIVAMTPRPFMGWAMIVTTYIWNFVAWVAGKQEFSGQYSIRITGNNPHYIKKEDDDELHSHTISLDD